MAALIAWKGEISSILDLLLLGFAMVVPPAIALGFVLYWRRTTDFACFWGMTLGYAIGLLWYAAIRVVEVGWVDPTPGTLGHRLFADGGVDPSYVTTAVPLVLIWGLSWLGPADGAAAREAKEGFYQRLRTGAS